MQLVKKKNNNVVMPTLNFSDDWLPIKQIMNGMILTEDGYYVTGVKVIPKNIFMMEIIILLH